jgi:hypothetical protein
MHQHNRERGVREAGDSGGCEERRREAPRFHNFLCGHYERFRLTSIRPEIPAIKGR